MDVIWSNWSMNDAHLSKCDTENTQPEASPIPYFVLVSCAKQTALFIQEKPNSTDDGVISLKVGCDPAAESV